MKHSTVIHVSPKAYGIDWPRIRRLALLVALAAVWLWVRS